MIAPFVRQLGSIWPKAGRTLRSPRKAERALVSRGVDDGGQPTDDDEVTLETETRRATEPRCWCCDREYGGQQLVHLGFHPEVTVCLECARWLHRRAVERRDELEPGLGARPRAGVRAARELVMRHGWHDHPVLGRPLRWLDRFLR
jgi:hypothetical protein